MTNHPNRSVQPLSVAFRALERAISNDVDRTLHAAEPDAHYYACTAHRAAFGVYPDAFPDLVRARCCGYGRMIRGMSRGQIEAVGGRAAAIDQCARLWPTELASFGAICAARIPLHAAKFAVLIDAIDAEMAALRSNLNAGIAVCN